MKRILSNSIYLYSSKFVPLSCLSLITYVPLLFLHTFIVNIIYSQSRFMEYPGVVGDAANGIFMLVFLTIAQVPFIKLTILYHEDEESIFKKSLGFSMDRMISMYVFACLYALCVFLGGLLFVIPGLIVLFLFYYVPYFIADGVKSYKVAIRKSVSLVKKRFLIILVIIGAITAIQLLFENVLFAFISFYTDTYFVFLFTKIVLQMFILPFQVILVTNMFIDIKIDQTNEIPTHTLLKS
ncbi:hypothetical protein [Cytobacillus dafuensis]|uniref:DUF975 family protein n=1 Tax=Cytobacillus dafuensis TaxID=1742359 RepID=A0A5B8Z0D0_CYTDA|nr:hypothetical protein [Cytobacillus dafuensis]QED46422.1 hypothetical protein FSZ17_03585 [Cytobacillus dafuensis]